MRVPVGKQLITSSDKKIFNNITNMLKRKLQTYKNKSYKN